MKKKPPPISKHVLREGATLAAGKYRLLKRIGYGGNGIVWLADQVNLSQQVVIKFPIDHDDRQSQQLDAETNRLAELSNRHPNFVNILDSGSFMGRPFIVVQYLCNGDLSGYVLGAPGCQRGRFLHESSDWLVAIAKALDFLHGCGYLHRDVKPANILFDSSFSPYLSDFGLAHSSSDISERETITARSRAGGSRPYKAPELRFECQPSPKSDQYALAVTVFEFLCGQRPFSGDDGKEYIDAMKRVPSFKHYRPDAAVQLDDVFFRALSFESKSRFDSCHCFAKAVTNFWPFHVASWHAPAMDALTSSGTSTETARSEDFDRARSAESDPTAAADSSRPAKRQIKLERIMRQTPTPPADAVE